MSLKTTPRRGALTLGASATAAAGAALLPAGAAWAQTAPPSGTTAGPAGARTVGGLRFFGPQDAPFDQAGRRSLAHDALVYFPDLHGLHPGRSHYQLPPTPVLGTGQAAHPRPWQLTVPGGVPLYLMPFLSVDATADPALTVVEVNGTPLTGLADYRHDGVRAPVGINLYDHTLCDLVIATPAPGTYRIEITRDDPKDEKRRFTLTYELTVQEADALGPLVLREPLEGGAARLWAIHQDQRRALPDAETAAALGYAATAIKDASRGALELFKEGGTLPALREGMVLKGSGAPLFRVAGGRRAWLRGAEAQAALTPIAPAAPPAQPAQPASQTAPEGMPAGTGEGVETQEQPAEQASVQAPAPAPAQAPAQTPVAPGYQQVEGVVLQTLAPELRQDTLIISTAGDLYHADNGALRHVPTWEWIEQRGLSTGDVTRLPERLLAVTPRTRPHGLPGGVIWMDAVVDSAALATRLPYRVFLPPGYYQQEAQTRRYPVLFLLHGMSGRWDEWGALLELERTLNQVSTADLGTQLVVVMPQGGTGYWVNQRGGVRWAEYVAKDLVAHVDGAYRTLARREGRALGGLSMGGHGAFQIALNNQDVFGTIGAHTPSLPEPAQAPGYFGGAGGYPEYDPETLVKNSTARPPRIWIDTGMEDRWTARTERLREAVRARGWEHEWRLNPGSHTREYWIGNSKDYLGFYLGSFAKLGAGAR